ncbi:MAG TPA: VOC family protein [Candidatus Polarisedimenticolia bacterium]|nr:VOC family protein [Candidatus Polarisedimenticolia bacterium]
MTRTTRWTTIGMTFVLSAFMLAIAAGAWPAAWAAPAVAATKAPVVAVESICLTVSDMERSVKFFSEVLSFEKASDVEVEGADYERLEGLFGLRMRRVRMTLGEESIELTEYLAPEGRPLPVDSRSNDRWFQHIAIVVRDMDEAYRRLRASRVRHASSGPQRLPDWNPNAGGIQAFYFKDPDGHALEVIHFPVGKGDPRWQRATDRLFLGIDHTAIVVGDTEASLRFYRDALGLRIAGESENYGTEQEHLNNVFGARLRITALRAAAGPGIELLEYLAPRDGRPYPPDSRSSDLWQWQTRLATSDAAGAAREARLAGGSWLSPGAVSLAERTLGLGRGATVRDPDGHVLLIVER